MSYLNINDFNESEISSLVLTYKIISSISLASSLIIIIIYWYFKEIRDFILEATIYLSISNIFYSLSAFFPYSNNRDENSSWCGFQAFNILTFQYSGCIWVCAISYSCLLSVIKREHLEKNSIKYRLLFLIISSIISLSLASIILFTDSYGPTGAWCWVDVYRSSTLIHKLVLFYYCLNWFFIILNTFFIYKLITTINYIQVNKNKYLTMYGWMKWFPIVQVICIFPSTVSRIYNILDMPSNFTLVFIQTIFGSIIGLGYLILYVRIPQVKNSLSVFFSRICNKGGERSVDNFNSTSFDFSEILSSNNPNSNVASKL